LESSVAVKQTCTIWVGPTSLTGLATGVRTNKNTHFSFLAKFSYIPKAARHFATDTGNFCSSEEVILIQLS
jgi:hypothetical protein